MVCFLLCDSTPPQKSEAKGGRGDLQNKFLAHADNSNMFAVDLQNACCAEPVACCATACCIPCASCYFRNAVLEKYGNGIDDYMCCQGYMGKICCIDTADMCKGNTMGLCCEGCCCGVLGLSITRLYVMDMKSLRTDPMDNQIIQFSNCLQMLSCFCHLLAIFDDQFREAAALIDLVADLVTASVAGCMGAQIQHELMKDRKIAPGPLGAPPKAEEMER